MEKALLFRHKEMARVGAIAEDQQARSYAVSPTLVGSLRPASRASPGAAALKPGSSVSSLAPATATSFSSSGPSTPGSAGSHTWGGEEEQQQQGEGEGEQGGWGKE